MSVATQLSKLLRRRQQPERIDAIGMNELPLSETARFEAVVALGAATIRQEIDNGSQFS